jgi:hypothetical protein
MQGERPALRADGAEVGPVEAVAVSGLVCAASFVGAVSGFGFALLLVPPLALVLGAPEAVVLANVLGTSHHVAMFLRFRAAADRPLAARMVVLAVPGMAVGLLVIELVSARTLQAILAANVILATILLWRGVRLPRRTLASDGATGFISGVLNTSTAMNGPPIVLYLQAQRFAPDAFRGTIAVVFLFSNAVALALYGLRGRLDSDLWTSTAAGGPGLVIGWVAGTAVATGIGPGHFRGVVMAALD